MQPSLGLMHLLQAMGARTPDPADVAAKLADLYTPLTSSLRLGQAQLRNPSSSAAGGTALGAADSAGAGSDDDCELGGIDLDQVTRQLQYLARHKDVLMAERHAQVLDKLRSTLPIPVDNGPSAGAEAGHPAGVSSGASWALARDVHLSRDVGSDAMVQILKASGMAFVHPHLVGVAVC